MVVTVLENVQSQFSVAAKLCVTEVTVKRSTGGSMTAVKVLQHFCFSLSVAVADATIEAYVLCIVNVLQQFGNLQELGITDSTGEGRLCCVSLLMQSHFFVSESKVTFAAFLQKWLHV